MQLNRCISDNNLFRSFYLSTIQFFKAILFVNLSNQNKQWYGKI